MNRYVLDANVFIQAKNDHYGMDFCPAFWDWLIEGHSENRVCSIKAICDELTLRSCFNTSRVATSLQRRAARRKPAVQVRNDAWGLQRQACHLHERKCSRRAYAAPLAFCRRRRFPSYEVLKQLLSSGSDDEPEDELSKWAKSQGSCLFRGHDQPMVDQLPAVAGWVAAQNYTQQAVSAFLGCADLHIVAYALAHRCTVVTHEKSSDSKNKLKIPDVCRGLKVA